MRVTGLPVATVTAVLIGVTGSTLATAGSAHADTPGALPLSRFSAMVADGPHGHLFLSGGLGNGSLAVTDFDGNPVGAVDGEPNATSMVLSPDGATLYVALPGNNAVFAVDTATLKEKARYSTGTADEPSYLAFAGGKVWFGYGGPGAGASVRSMPAPPPRR